MRERTRFGSFEVLEKWSFWTSPFLYRCQISPVCMWYACTCVHMRMWLLPYFKVTQPTTPTERVCLRECQQMKCCQTQHEDHAQQRRQEQYLHTWNRRACPRKSRKKASAVMIQCEQKDDREFQAESVK